MARAVAGSIKPERGNRTFLVLAVVAALIAAVLVFAALSGGGGDESGSSVTTVPVVVAAQEIPAGTRLTEEMLKVAPVSPETLLQGTSATVPVLVGYVARYPVATGEQITLNKVGLESEDEEVGLSFIIPPGQRAIAASVTQVSSVGGLLLPGDRVDVIGVFTATDQITDEKAVTLFQNVEVLAVAQTAQEAVPPSQSAEEGEAASAEPLAQRPQDAVPQPQATTVTLALTPEQTQLLALVQERAKVWLSLRPFGDEDQVELAESNLAPFTAR